MLYHHCPRCRLAIRCRADSLLIEHCPRCLARAGIATTMFSSPLDATQLRAAGRDDHAWAPASKDTSPVPTPRGTHRRHEVTDPLTRVARYRPGFDRL